MHVVVGGGLLCECTLWFFMAYLIILQGEAARLRGAFALNSARIVLFYELSYKFSSTGGNTREVCTMTGLGE